MADIVKLKKQVQKCEEVAEQRKLEVFEAVERFGAAQGALAVAREELESAEAIEMARELRANRRAEG